MGTSEFTSSAGHGSLFGLSSQDLGTRLASFRSASAVLFKGSVRQPSLASLPQPIVRNVRCPLFSTRGLLADTIGNCSIVAVSYFSEPLARVDCLPYHKERAVPRTVLTSSQAPPSSFQMPSHSSAAPSPSVRSV